MTSPHSDGDGPSVRRDVELVKAALLYADEVELVSPGAAMLGSVAAIATGGPTAIIDVLAALDDETLKHLNDGKPMPDNFRELIPMLPLMLDPQFAELAGVEHEIGEMREHFASAQGEFESVAESLIEQAGAGDLVPALESGILTLDTAGMDAGDTDAQVAAYVERIRRRLRDPLRKVLFDSEAADLVSSLVGQPGADDHGFGIKRAGQAAVGAGLVSRLPAFPGAPMEMVLGLRAELAVPLVRYRAATLELAQNLTPAFGIDLEAQVDDLWTSKVAPAILEIEETLAENNFVRELAKRSTSSVKTLLAGGAGLYTGLTVADSLPGAAAAVAGAAVGVAPAVGEAAWAARDARCAARRSNIFYLYDANRRLG